MFDSPLEFCPRCRQYVALDSMPTNCAARSQCGGESCPLEPYFTGTQTGQPPVVSMGEDGRTGYLSPAATSLLDAIAGCGQFEFSGADLERLLRKPEAGIGSIVDELRNRGLVQLADGPEEERRYELTAAGQRCIAENMSRT